MLGVAGFLESEPAFGGVVTQTVREFEKIRFPCARDKEVDGFKPEVGTKLLVFEVAFDIEDNSLGCIKSDVSGSASMIGTGKRCIRTSRRIGFLPKAKLQDFI